MPNPWKNRRCLNQQNGVNNNVNSNTTVISGGIDAQQTGNAGTVQESNGQSFDAIALTRAEKGWAMKRAVRSSSDV